MIRFQRRGPMLDIIWGFRPATVICKHRQIWQEGGLGCVVCMARWKKMNKHLNGFKSSVKTNV